MERWITRSKESNLPIEIIYMSGAGKVTKRVITVTNLDGLRVMAYCHLRKSRRIFLLNQILAASLLTDRSNVV